MNIDNIIKAGQGYALGLLVFIFGMVATAAVYVAGNGLVNSATGIDLDQAAFWFRDTFLWIGIGVSCVLSTFAATEYLGRGGTPLWSWPLVVFLSTGFLEYLVNDYSYAVTVTHVIGPVVLFFVSLVTVSIVWVRAHKVGIE